MGKKIQFVLFIVLGLSVCLKTTQSVYAQSTSNNQALASTLIQQTYVKYSWQASGGVFMIVVDAIAQDEWSDYERIAYFRYIDENDYIKSVHEILPDTCKEDLNLNLENVSQTVNKLNSNLAFDSSCAELIYDAKRYHGFFDSLQEDKFHFQTLETYDPNHAYQLTQAAYNFIQQHLTLGNGRVSYKEIKDRYIAVRESMNGKPFETNLNVSRLIMSGLTPLLTKIIAFCDVKGATNNKWASLKARASNLKEHIGIAYGNSGQY